MRVSALAQAPRGPAHSSWPGAPISPLKSGSFCISFPPFAWGAKLYQLTVANLTSGAGASRRTRARAHDNKRNRKRERERERVETFELQPLGSWWQISPAARASSRPDFRPSHLIVSCLCASEIRLESALGAIEERRRERSRQQQPEGAGEPDERLPLGRLPSALLLLLLSAYCTANARCHLELALATAPATTASAHCCASQAAAAEVTAGTPSEQRGARRGGAPIPPSSHCGATIGALGSARRPEAASWASV